MAESEPEGELSALLESALAEFGCARDTDEELDSMMAKMDQQAAQSAARRFEQAMQATGQQQEAGMSEDERKAAENFQNMLKALIEAEQKALENEEQDYDRSGAQAFIGQLKKLSEEDPANIAEGPQYETLMSLVQTFFSKELMYPPLKQLLQKFPEFISKHSELDLDTKARYEKQIDVLQRVCAEYEKDESDDVEEMRRRFDSISTLMMELQSYGYPPEELVGEAPPGWVTDSQTGLPRVDDISKAAESCSLM